MVNQWQLPPEFLSLKSDDLHIWRTNLDLSLSTIDILKQYLSSDEIKRSGRFKFDLHRHRYIVSRAVLRIILSKYLNIAPGELIFVYSDRGKPQIMASQNPEHLEFNMSHSENLSLYGLVKKYSIGIDVEYLKPMKDIKQIAERFFTSRERAILSNLSPQTQVNLFFKLWTAKEAYLKCTGEGISAGLDKFEVRFEGTKSIGLTGLETNLQGISQWYFASFLADQHYQSTAIVNSEEKFTLSYFEL